MILDFPGYSKCNGLGQWSFVTAAMWLSSLVRPPTMLGRQDEEMALKVLGG